MWREIRLDLTDAMLAIRRRWFRSVLSSLGIAIGVCALIVTLSISEGALDEATAQYHQLGLNTLRIQTPESTDVTVSSRSLSEAEVETVRSLVPKLSRVAASSVTSDVLLKSLDKSASGMVVYATEDWLKTEKLSLAQGRSISIPEFKFGDGVCLIGGKLAQDLMVSIAESVVSFGLQSCVVIGVMETVEGGFVQNDDIRFTDINRSIVLPISAMPQANRYELSPLSEISVSLPFDRTEDILRVARDLGLSLDTKYGSLMNYQLIVPLELLIREEESQESFILIMMSISFMVLLVGGVGIMNIMLTHISEQTREIGLRLAVGAEPKRILQIFLLHSLLITFAGCILGSGVGLLFVLVFGLLSDGPISLSVFALIAGPVFSMLIGLLFGLYPALRASQMDPVIMLKEQ